MQGVNNQKILKVLEKLYPDPKSELNYNNEFELCISVLLSAQCTDKLVNTVTPALFAAYPTIQSYADTSVAQIDTLVAKINFHTNKSKNIHAAARMIMDTYGGEVPDTMEKLDALPGVARKTANVILGAIFGKAEGIVIDTHGIRLTNRLGLTHETDPVKIEQALMKLIPRDKWVDFGHLLTLHGRYVCKARAHTCEGCCLGDLCPEYSKT